MEDGKYYLKIDDDVVYVRVRRRMSTHRPKRAASAALSVMSLCTCAQQPGQSAAQLHALSSVCVSTSKLLTDAHLHPVTGFWKAIML